MSRKDNERTQARVGLASNILGITAGAAALGTAVKNPALRRPSAGNAGPVTRRVLHKIKSPRGKAALIAGGAGGAIALQAANLGGDFVSNRVLSREAKMSKSANDYRREKAREDLREKMRKELRENARNDVRDRFRAEVRAGVKAKVIENARTKSAANRGDEVNKSIEQSIVSKSDHVDRGTGIGMNLEKAWKGEPGDKRNTKYAASSLVGGAIVPGVGNVLGPVGYGMYRSGEESEARRKESIKRRKAAIAAKKKAREKSRHVEKRNFNAESDRQRRLGTYAGVGIGTGVVAGAAAGRGLSLKGMDAGKGRILAVKGPKGAPGAPAMTKKWMARRGGLAALAALSAGGGIAAYKRGISERNRSYM